MKLSTPDDTRNIRNSAPKVKNQSANKRKIGGIR